ncbi:hypothetical protein PsorP6_001190 [Peronosclerospora sorghi]|uniref:Uncharacterized protein n=1 Tax=Peronosclerospora sorghi TaxID=230839 RepID=A0ACC0WXG0_9STRA|nr:hypothetical protein PsorP6_001190 [Peronosclerospora sorghi]
MFRYHIESLILAGDFNVDNQTFRDEVTNLELTIKAHEPHRIGNQRYTSELASIPRQRRRDQLSQSKMEEITSDIARVVHSSGWTTTVVSAVFSTVLCTNSSGSGITSPYKQPSTCPTLEALVNQVSVFTVGWSDANGTTKMAMRDLSDHYLVLGKFTFPLTRGKGMDNVDPSTYHLDGCSYHICLCKGPQYYYKGNHTERSKLDTDHPVNRNCLLDIDLGKCFCGPK